ncbi:MAG: GNAT family N-acetyltransferase [Acidimicrobiales bacterium]|nr:GNAT family N-acetyltransferase [Acidimicrobiales bacterium]
MTDPRRAPIQQAAWSELPARTAYRLAALRSAVFVVEQRCPYLDLDGRDLDAGVTQLWIEAGDEPAPVAALRVLPEGDGWRIGRVVTDPAYRAVGLAGRLLEEVLARRDGPFVLDAQSYLTGWYGRFGFVTDGPEFLEDGIPHTPMRRP